MFKNLNQEIDFLDNSLKDYIAGRDYIRERL